MKFEKLLRRTTEDLSDLQVVGLAMYYLLEKEERDNIRPAEVRDFLRNQPISITDNHVSAYPSQLKSKDLFDSTNGNYILTIEGKEHFERVADISTDNQHPRDDVFLDISTPEDEFYRTLVDDIERTHTHRIYDATLILSRKLFENLLIEIMRGHYGVGDAIDMYYNKDERRFKNFSTILENFEDNISDFKPYAPDIDNTGYFQKLDEFRENGNAAAHSITVNVDGQIDDLSEDATEIANLLFRVKKQVAIASEKW